VEEVVGEVEDKGGHVVGYCVGDEGRDDRTRFE